ncbi:MAG: hypothetical protein ABIC68_00220 [Candidatus Omnitrophota bacterium]
MKKFLIIIGIITAIIITLNVFKNEIIKAVVDGAATKALGTEVNIGSFSFKILTQTIDIKNLEIENPKGFPKENFINIPLIHVVYDLNDLLQKKIHLKELEVNLKELTIVKNKDKQLNVDALAVAQPAENKKEKKDKKEAAEAIPMQIDTLILSVGKIIHKDYSVGSQPQIKIINVDFKKKTYKNITSAQQLTSLIITECLKEAGIKSAKIYGAASLLGASFLPAGVAMALTKSDSVQEEIKKEFIKTYEACLKVLGAQGKVTSKNQKTGILKASVNGAGIVVKLEKTSDTNTTITVSARKFLLPKQQEAEKILYLIKEELKLNN